MLAIYYILYSPIGDICFNSTMYYKANELYPHKAQISNKTLLQRVEKKYLLVTDIFLKNSWKHLECIVSPIEQII